MSVQLRVTSDIPDMTQDFDSHSSWPHSVGRRKLGKESYIAEKCGVKSSNRNRVISDRSWTNGFRKGSSSPVRFRWPDDDVKYETGFRLIIGRSETKWIIDNSPSWDIYTLIHLYERGSYFISLYPMWEHKIQVLVSFASKPKAISLKFLSVND